jgi:hypothetical protein
VYLPFYGGLCRRGSDERFVAVYAKDAEVKPQVSAAATSSMRHVLESLQPENAKSRFRTADSSGSAPQKDAARTQADSRERRACDCGGTLVLRHRRSDGQPFWGCSRFPACRQTLAAPPLT